MSKVNNFKDKIKHFYLKSIKKTMYCPACKDGRMRIDKKTDNWVCQHCDYKLSDKEFVNDYIFWFCDECDSYLNNQEDFDINTKKHICRVCGYENDIVAENIKGVCSDCGKLLDNPNNSLCEECKKNRKSKAKDWLIIAGGVAAGVALAFGLSKNSIENKSTSINYNNENFDYVDDDWLNSATEEELRDLSDDIQEELSYLDYDSDEYLELSNLHIDVVNTISSKFPINLPRREHGWYLPNDD